MSERETDAIGLAEINTLRRAGLLTAGQYLDAVYRCRDADFWTRWALRTMLALGAAHLLAGIVFFFAYNWDNLAQVGKFAILEVGIVVCAAAALFVKLERLAGQVLLIAASILVGVLLAVIGQVYQTGADVYDLFSVWAMLIIPWVVASRSAAHWFVWLVIVFVAFTLYAIQILMPLGILSLVELTSLLAVVTAVVLAMREIAVRAGAVWLDAGWTRLILVFVALVISFMPAVGHVFDEHNELIGLLTFIVMVAALAGVYLRRWPAFGVVALTTGFAALFLMAVGGRILFETIGFEWDVASSILPSLVLLVLWCAALTTGTLKFLARLRRTAGRGDTDA